jgi:hypothetical protein
MKRTFQGSFVLRHPDGSRFYGAGGASGNAKQRRKIVRRWKADGYAVTPYLTHEEARRQQAANFSADCAR